MSPRPENQFPTIRDLRDRLSELVDNGLGDHPVQVVVVPDSTMQVLARSAGDDGNGRPAIMIEFDTGGSRLPVSFISADRLSGHSMKSASVQ